MWIAKFFNIVIKKNDWLNKLFYKKNIKLM